jgi:hypothetical protein
MTATESSQPIAAPAGLTRQDRYRGRQVYALIVLASLVGLLAITAIWINRQLLSDSASAQTSTALVRDAAVRRALANYVVDQLYTDVDVSGEIEQQLPSQLKPFAAPAAAALRDPAVQAVDFLLAQPSVQAQFAASVADAHNQLIDVLENKTGLGVTTSNGTVQVNLGHLVRQVGTQLGIPAAALDKLPPNAGVITVMHSDQLSLAQTAIRAVRILSLWLIVLVLALLALALYLAAGFRRRALRTIGWALVVVGLVVIVARRLTGDYVVGGLTTPTYAVPAQHVWVIGTSILDEMGWATILYGVLVVLGAALAGPTLVARAVRRWIAPVLNQRPAIVVTGVAVAFLLAVLWGGTYALRTPLGIVILGGLLAIGVYVLRRQTLREFPDRTLGVDLRATASGAIGRVREFAASREPASGWRIGRHRSASEELTHLAELHASGVLTDEEFARAKANILER